MAVSTVVEEYVLAAMRGARYESTADGMIAGSVAACPGLLAFGADAHQCSLDLWRRLHEWVHLWLTEGLDLPVLDGIDLNTSRAALLATYASPVAGLSMETFYADEVAMEAAFAERDAVRAATQPKDRRKSRVSRSAAR